MGVNEGSSTDEKADQSPYFDHWDVAGARGVLALLTSRPPVSLDHLVKEAGVREGVGGAARLRLRRVLVGVSYSSLDCPLFLRYRDQRGPYLSGLSAWIQRRTMEKVGGVRERWGEWRVGADDWRRTRVLVATYGASRESKSRQAGVCKMPAHLRHGLPHVLLDTSFPAATHSFLDVLRALSDTSVYMSPCGEAALPGLFLRKGSHLVLFHDAHSALDECFESRSVGVAVGFLVGV